MSLCPFFSLTLSIFLRRKIADYLQKNYIKYNVITTNNNNVIIINHTNTVSEK